MIRNKHGEFYKKINRNLDLRFVKYFKVISVLNYIDKVLEKLVAKSLSDFSKNFMKLQSGQIKT